MLKFKILYKKMMDDLKDAEMWIDWAKKIEDEEPEIAKFLYSSAKNRVMSDFPQTKELFKESCEKDQKGCYLEEVLDEELDDWHEKLQQKLNKI